MAISNLLKIKTIIDNTWKRVWSTIQDHTFSVSVKNQIEIPEVNIPEVKFPEIPTPIDTRTELQNIVKTIINQTQELKTSPDTSATKEQLLNILNEIKVVLGKSKKDLTPDLIAEIGALREDLSQIGNQIPKTDLKPLEDQIGALGAVLDLKKYTRYDDFKVYINERQFEKLLKAFNISVSAAGGGGNLRIASGDVTSENPLPVLADQKESTNLETGDLEAVGTTAVEVTFTGVTQAIHIQAHPDNDGILYVGKSNVTNAGLNAGAILQPGDDIVLHYNDKDNAVYVVSDTAAQQFMKMALL